MRPLELVPDLSHCIETTAKKEYEEAVTEYLGKKEADTTTLEEKIELLCTFLQSADFKQLRRESERHLIQGRKIKFLLCPQGEKLHYEMLVE